MSDSSTKTHVLNKKLLCDQLRYHEIKTVRVSFSGSGDSGQITGQTCETIDGDTSVLPREFFDTIRVPAADMPDSFEWDSKANKAVLRDWRKEPPSLRELIEQVCLDELEIAHCGWEIDAGSNGEIVITPLAVLDRQSPITINICHNYHDSIYEDEEYNDE